MTRRSRGLSRLQRGGRGCAEGEIREGLAEDGGFLHADGQREFAGRRVALEERDADIQRLHLRGGVEAVVVGVGEVGIHLSGLARLPVEAAFDEVQLAFGVTEDLTQRSIDPAPLTIWRNKRHAGRVIESVAEMLLAFLV